MFGGDVFSTDSRHTYGYKLWVLQCLDFFYDVIKVLNTQM